MGFIQKVEQKIELIVGDTLALVFGGKVQLQEVTFALRRQAREGTIKQSHGRYLTPSRYTVYISPEDRSGILEKSNVSLQLAADLEHFIQDNSWYVDEPVIIFIQASGVLRSGQFRVQAHSSTAHNSESAPAKKTAFLENGHKSTKNSIKSSKNGIVHEIEHEEPHHSSSEVAYYDAEFPDDHNSVYVDAVLEEIHPNHTRTETSFRDESINSSPRPASSRVFSSQPKNEISYSIKHNGTRNNGEYIPHAGNNGNSFSSLNSIQAVELIDNSDPTQVYELSPGITVLGRGQDADLRILDSGISRKHVEIIYKPELIEIVDLGSTNGTTVNHSSVHKQELKDGDLISLGHSEFTVRIFIAD